MNCPLGAGHAQCLENEGTLNPRESGNSQASAFQRRNGLWEVVQGNEGLAGGWGRG